MAISSKLAEPNKHLGAFICIPDDQVCQYTVTINDMDKISFHNTNSSLAVEPELLVFGKEILSHVIYRYSILTNTWSSGIQMNAPRCLFGSASFGEISILAHGGKILSSAELYNLEIGTWKTLPSMNKRRKMCFVVFMGKKFYVIGGIGVTELSKVLFTQWRLILSGTGKWTEI
ncbi:hypothetical protein KY285_019169 [Solanum tuberosum]|nr:hypothetical protein KY285_019169 [Solanum tuberosum]